MIQRITIDGVELRLGSMTIRLDEPERYRLTDPRRVLEVPERLRLEGITLGLRLGLRGLAQRRSPSLCRTLVESERLELARGATEAEQAGHGTGMG